MFTGKVIASLFLLAAAGFLDGQSPAAPQAGGLASAARPAEAAVAPMPAQLQQAVHRELQDRLRRDLDDASLQVRLGALDMRRDGLLVVAADGDALVLMGAGGDVPLRVEADWDLATQRLARVDYRVTGPARTVAKPADAVGERLRAAIASRVGDGLAAEFAGQRSEFQLLEVERVQSGRHRMLVTGTGITRFPGEGAAYTRFSATVDKFDGELEQVDYELLGDAPGESLAAR
jgi:hypothetical protein